MADKKDTLIIEALKSDSKASIVDIAKKTGLPGTTIHNRIKKLCDEKVITGYTIKLDNKKLGKDITAFIAVTVDYKLLKEKKISQQALAEKLSRIPAVEETNIITGISDIMIKVRMKNIDELNNFITNELRNFDGVEKTQTMVVLKEILA